MILIIVFLILFAIVAIVLWYHHQCNLRDRAHLMREAVRNREFTFHLNTKGLAFGEKALQEALNDLGYDINKLVAQNEVESWQRLTRVLTHEIMNATAPIKSISQAYLSSPKIKGTMYEEGIKAIYDTSVGLAAFVDSYRKLTALQDPVLEDVNLNDFVTSVSPIYPDVEWRINVPQDRVVHIDVNLLRQVFINIVKNAIEAGAKTIDLRWKGEMLLISNDGQSIPPDVARDIFVPFFTTKTTGNGIGLSLSRQIMMKQGMNLSLADSPVSGFHTTFCLG